MARPAGTEFARGSAVTASRSLSRLLAVALILCTALVSVGLTAPAEAPFTISIRPVLLRLAVEVDVKFGTHHFHTQWSALSDQPTS